MKLDELHLQFANFIRVNGREPSIIITSPATYGYFEEEALKNYNIKQSFEEKVMKFMGIEILRSLDVKDDEIRIY